MKNIKRIVAMALAIVMLLTMVAGCAKKEAAQIASDPTESHDHTETEPAVEATAEPTVAPTKAEEEVQYASVVFISVNPKFAIYFDGDGKVVRATAENDDGTALDVDMEALTGMTAANAVEALLDTIAEAGYFADGEHDIELTFYGEVEGEVEDVAALGELEKAIFEAAEAYVANKGIKATVKAKVSPAAAPMKLEDIKKLPAPPAPGKDKEPTKEDPKPTEGTKPTEPKPTKPTDPKPTEPKPTKPTEPSHKHNYKSETVKATCKEGGYTKYTCDCGDTYTDKETEKLGHDYKTEVVKATYETGGYTKYTCQRCGHSYEGNQTAPLYKPTEPTEGTSGETEPTTPSDAKCPYCGGPHYLYECPAAKEEEPEPVVCGYCGTTNCDYPATGDKTKCPSYNEKQDATKYCQTCGKPTSVCTQYTKDMTCPKCGTFVTKFTCHYC